MAARAASASRRAIARRSLVLAIDPAQVLAAAGRGCGDALMRVRGMSVVPRWLMMSAKYGLPVACAISRWKRKSGATVSPATATLALEVVERRRASPPAARRCGAARPGPADSVSRLMRSSSTASTSTSVAIWSARIRNTAESAPAASDEGADAVVRLDQRRRLQLRQRLAHHRAADAELAMIADSVGSLSPGAGAPSRIWSAERVDQRRCARLRGRAGAAGAAKAGRFSLALRARATAAVVR